MPETASAAISPNTAALAAMRRAVLNSLRELALIPVIVIVFIYGAVFAPGFLTGDNLTNVAQYAAPLGMVVVAEALTLLIGKMDISLQAIYGIAPLIGGWLIVPQVDQGLGSNLPPIVGILICILIGLAVGAVNGILVIRWGFNAFIFTLAMNILLHGIQTGVTNGRTVYHMPDQFLWLGGGTLLGLPVAIWVTSLTFLVAGVFLRYHRVGRAIFAIGGNLEAARAAGIKVDKIRIGVFIAAGALSAIAGLMTAGQTVSITTDQGQGYIFDVFAAAVIGGISLDGGRGRMLGALTGVVLLKLFINVLVLLQVPSFWQDAVDGAVILIALGIARVIGTGKS